jgi:hypothetical protein
MFKFIGHLLCLLGFNDVQVGGFPGFGSGRQKTYFTTLAALKRFDVVAAN